MAPIPEIIRNRNNYKTAIKNKKYTAESVWNELHLTILEKKLTISNRALINYNWRDFRVLYYRST